MFRTLLGVAALDDPRIDALGMLIETHDTVVGAIADDLAASSELSFAFLGVLIRLGRSPGQEQRMTQLAHEMTITTSGLTRLIDRMEAAGLVERTPCPEDGRGLLARLTPAGRARLHDALPDHLEQVERRYAQHLTGDELEQLTDLLRRARDGVRAMES